MKTPAVDSYGIMRRYRDAAGKRHDISNATRVALRKAMGTVVPAKKARPTNSAQNQFCHLPRNLRAWGWAVQLYSLRSRKSWGIGDFADLRNFARWSARELNAGFLLLNPLGAATPILPQQASPYFPSSRLFKNPLYLCLKEIPGAKKIGSALKKFSEAGRELNRERLIHRDAVFDLKMRALEEIWKRFPGDAAFDRFCEERGDLLKRFASFCALAEHHDGGWTDWPQEFQDPDSPAVMKFCSKRHHRVKFYQWLQWLCDEQLARAGREIPLMMDLPVGVDPAGADAWMWQKFLARGVAMGAPPDEFNTQGQNWGLQPFVPHRLRAADYEPFRQTIRAALRHAHGLRIDHVMGLFRLFWIPENGLSADGAYVRYDTEELLNIVAEESYRAQAVVIGEDLGTVEGGVREEMRRRKMLSYRLLWFEKSSPKKFPLQALSSVTTHDLFTIAGLWTGNDLKAQKKSGMKPNVESTNQIVKRLRKNIGVNDDAPMEEVIARIYARLAKAPSMLLAASLDDALAVEERPNMPGTTTQWPNWSIALPETLEAIQTKELPRKIANALSQRT